MMLEQSDIGFDEVLLKLNTDDFEQRIGDYSPSTARAISAEMHSGFFALRQKMPMNCRAKERNVEMTDDLIQNIERVKTIWTKTREQYGKAGIFLFGSFSIADAMYAPVVFRFKTYGVELDDLAQNYCDNMLQLPSMQAWLHAAKKEPEFIDCEEVGE